MKHMFDMDLETIQTNFYTRTSRSKYDDGCPISKIEDFQSSMSVFSTRIESKHNRANGEIDKGIYYDSKKRLIYLIKEEKRGNELIKIIIDLAMEEKDESFVKMLANQLEVRDVDEGYVEKGKREIYGDNNDDVVILNKVASFLLSSDAKDNIDYVLALFEKHKKEDVFLKNSISKLRIERGNTELTNKVFGLLGIIENILHFYFYLGI